VRPGYWFGLGNSIALQENLSPLQTPVYHTGGANTSVTVRDKSWKWSDGTTTRTMDNQDIMFFLNMDKAQTYPGVGSSAFCGYSPGFGVPDQIKSVVPNGGLTGHSVTITFTGHPSENWLTYNELSQIIPMATAWDTKGAGAAGCSTESFASVTKDGNDVCSQVFTYLSGLQMNNSLWSWSDGPYRQTQAQYSSGTPDGNNIQVANASYSGPEKAHAVKKIVYVPEASTATEIAQLQSNRLDYGYADPTDVTTSPGPGKAGHNLRPHLTQYKTEGSVLWGVFYWMFNFDNHFSTYHTSGKLPAWASELNQAYFRSAIQESINQPAIIKHVLNGYGVDTFSAIPAYPKNAFSSGIKNPYTYNAAKAKALMKHEGWNVNVFPARCAKANCGTAGYPIARNAKASIQLLVPSGDTSVKTQTDDEANDVRASGIQIVPVFKPATTYVQPACFGGADPWQLCGYGGWIYAPDYYPSGEVLFAAGSSSNSGGYDNPEMTKLIAATTTTGNVALNGNNPTYHTSFGQYSAQNLPFLWQPTPAGFIEIRSSIKGAQPTNPLGDFNPEYITAI
jgi:peptide/nickel transport system substrate-binding protein